jgi:hypothetical protein
MSTNLSHNPPGAIFRLLRQRLARVATFTTSDAVAAVPEHDAQAVRVTLHNMRRDRHIVGVSRGVYRFRGVV